MPFSPHSLNLTLRSSSRVISVWPRPPHPLRGSSFPPVYRVLEICVCWGSQVGFREEVQLALGEGGVVKGRRHSGHAGQARWAHHEPAPTETRRHVLELLSSTSVQSHVRKREQFSIRALRARFVQRACLPGRALGHRGQEAAPSPPRLLGLGTSLHPVLPVRTPSP